MAEKADGSRSSSGSGNRTLERAGAILDAVEDGPQHATEIARRTGLSVSTTHRLALAMAETDFLIRYEDGTFAPGRRIVQNDRDARSFPLIWELSSRIGETVQLWVRSGNQRICRVSVEAPHELQVTLPVGARLDLPAGSSGAILAQLPEAQADLERQGWVESTGKRSPGVASVSAPIVVGGRLVGALCVAKPVSRVQRSIGLDHGDDVRETARQIARKLSP
ncbi:IclR family transcriptional regulator [Corynebacterium halotolerans]|uniref:IclR family transcriptional regulator n=1 Tax=Corynebacterium halotolerans YIM 70093 = DSM 44683 TaxID=1121362 RepID=M1NVZ7_9CORY|nr:helix-turn-helix domain-containing protein [Corynebacterium halotolerans]AGF71670.1 IclR family transcriptional regulator [Corynebacterium halotolerans YIM 70093 = DSM 44683]